MKNSFDRVKALTDAVKNEPERPLPNKKGRAPEQMKFVLATIGALTVGRWLFRRSGRKV